MNEPVLCSLRNVGIISKAWRCGANNVFEWLLLFGFSFTEGLASVSFVGELKPLRNLFFGVGGGVHLGMYICCVNCLVV